MKGKTPYVAIAVCLTILLIPAAGTGYAKNAGGSEKKPAGDVAQAKHTTAKTASPVYVYNPRGKADPFKPFIETDPQVIKEREERLKQKKAREAGTDPKSLSPLQREETGKFLLVGIAGDQKRRTAIVEDKAANRHYPIFLGTYIGKRGGRVEAILDDRVIIAEVVPDEDAKGKKQRVDRIEMLLHRDQ